MPTTKRRLPKKPSRRPSRKPPRPVAPTVWPSIPAGAAKSTINEPIFIDADGRPVSPAAAAALTTPPFHAPIDEIGRPTPVYEMLKGIAGVPGPGKALPFHLTAPHKDSRGAIQNLADKPVGSAAVIISNADTTRARHYHKEDAHLCYVVEGCVHYYVRQAKSWATPSFAVYPAGQAFLTYPMEEHEMYFPERTVFVVLGNLTRKQEDYEADLVRLPFSLRDIYNAAHGGPAVVDPNAVGNARDADDSNVIPQADP